MLASPLSQVGVVVQPPLAIFTYIVVNGHANKRTDGW
jgi:hypothetical protein